MENNPHNGIKKEHRFTKLEGQFGSLQEEVRDIKRNDLKHLYETVSKIDRRLAFYAGALAVLAFVAPLLVRVLF